MTTRGVVLPLAIAAALGLAACAQESSAPQSAPTATTEGASTKPVRTASADDLDAEAREEGFASAAEQARARAYGEPAAEEQPEER
jgi:hypothetical protein